VQRAKIPCPLCNTVKGMQHNIKIRSYLFVSSYLNTHANIQKKGNRHTENWKLELNSYYRTQAGKNLLMKNKMKIVIALKVG